MKNNNVWLIDSRETIILVMVNISNRSKMAAALLIVSTTFYVLLLVVSSYKMSSSKSYAQRDPTTRQ